ncbi:MAG: acyltransferase family protein [Mailhella sp.]|nr:acyltransferase family protein [Mailhella sp.]
MHASRIHSLDNLRWAVVWLMVVFHAAMCYMAYAPEWWYVVDKAQPLFSATAFVCWTDIFIMPVMFFLSGYFGLMSFSKHGCRNFWKGKLRHIVAPWLFGSIAIAPFIAYLMLATRNAPTSFWEFYTTLFWGPYYQQAHYWYLGALTALYILLTGMCLLFPRFTQRADASAPPFLLPAVLFLFSAVSIGVISAAMHPDTWTFYGYVLVLQPVRVPTYIAVFFLGAWAWKKRWFTPGGYAPSCLPWCTAFLVTGLPYIWQKLFLAQYASTPALLVWANALYQSAFTVSALFGLLALFHRRFNRASRLSSALSATSYGVYYLHQPILFPLAWLFTSIPLASPLKFLAVSTLALLLCFALSRFVLNAIPPLRRCFRS